MTDSHYCPFCGTSDAFCGCPDDPTTSDLMRCPHCGGRWRRQYGSTSTACLHRACGKDGSSVEEPARYAPSLPPRQLEILRGAAAGDLHYVTRDGAEVWTLRGAVVTSDVQVLRQFRYLKPGKVLLDDGTLPGFLTDSGRLLLKHIRQDHEADGAGIDGEPFEPDENDPNGGWSL